MNRELNAVVLPCGSLELEWSESEAKEKIGQSQNLAQKETFKRFSTEPDSFLLYLGFCDKSVPLSVSMDFWRGFSNLFTKKISRVPGLEMVRHKAELLPDKEEINEILDNAPLVAGAEYLNRELLEKLWLGLNKTFCRAIKSFDGSVEDFFREYSPDIHLVGRVFFHLVENRDENFPFAFLATYTSSLDKKGKSRHMPLKAALEEYGKNSGKLLSLLTAVHLAARESPMISGLLESGELFHPLTFSSGDAYTFLKEVPLYENSGILCRIPDWWKGRTSGPVLSFNVGGSEPSMVGMDAILNFNAGLLLGDTPISEKEARRLLKESEGLAFIKNKWVAVDPEKLRRTLDAYDRAKEMMEEGLSLRDALRLQLNPNTILNREGEGQDVEISHGKWLESVLKKLRDPEFITSVKPGKGFKARLRPYQQKGLNWLAFLHSLRIGACLADDMGLGKTVQVLAFLNYIKSLKPVGASLLILPASLISNWISEIQRFSPGLKYLAAHPEVRPGKKVEAMDKKSLDAHDLVITTYALSQKYEWLRSYHWNYVILDEAQAIKNPKTKQTRAVKRFSAFNKIIITGTPMENHLTDLWSLFDFLNPGLLGNAGEFGSFVKKLKEGSGEGYSRLRKLIGPYILRRLKSDKSIISDLPDKVEMKTWSSLSKRQILLYKEKVEDIKKSLAETEGIQRKGIILAALMKFKQLCNHPDQYLGTGDFKEEESGKFSRLREICETIVEKREKALVFTQFKEITEPLAEFLERVFSRQGLILHGSIPVGKRKKIIEQFQSPHYVPFMVLSIKAGGIGLNLTEANHVIHFDRWWNPAVENQATDRAFRIGQKKNVVVHKFITKGTIEEKIDKMLEKKSELFREVIQGSGEGWITEMENSQLVDLFKLGL